MAAPENPADPLAEGFEQAFVALSAGDVATRDAAFDRALTLLHPLSDTVPRAAFGIALLCEKMAPHVRKPDLFMERALHFYGRAAAMEEDGLLTPLRAKNSLGSIYAARHEATSDAASGEMAVDWKSQAAAAGFAEAQMALARWHYAGRLVEQSFAKAREWMEKAWHNRGQLPPPMQDEIGRSLIVIDAALADPDQPGMRARAAAGAVPYIPS